MSGAVNNTMPNNKIESGSTREKATGLAWACTPDPRLPNALILGDSISIGYTLEVRKLLSGIANVYRPLAQGDATPANCEDTGKGIRCLHEWLGATRWDVIHFNFGLHDIKYLDETGAYVTPDKGKQVTLQSDYEMNLRRLAGEMKKTGASLIWGSTTPVPEGATGRVKGDEVAFNSIAEKVMEENAITINDLHSLVAPRCNELQKQRDVHFTEEGSAVEAAAVARIIKMHLGRG